MTRCTFLTRSLLHLSAACGLAASVGCTDAVPEFTDFITGNKLEGPKFDENSDTKIVIDSLDGTV